MELGWNCAEKKRYPDAIAECEAAVNRVPDEQVVLGICGRVFGLAGRRKEALMLLKRLMNVAWNGYVDPRYIAIVYDGIGDVDSAIRWHERAYKEHAANLYLLNVVPLSSRLRSDPRFLNLLGRINQPAAYVAVSSSTLRWSAFHGRSDGNFRVRMPSQCQCMTDSPFRHRSSVTSERLTVAIAKCNACVTSVIHLSINLMSGERWLSSNLLNAAANHLPMSKWRI